MLTISSLHKEYHGRSILALEDFVFADGIHWVRGENGAGKTTLFRSLAGSLVFRGDVWLDDTWHQTKHPVAYRKRLNYGEAEPVFPDFLKGDELISLVTEAMQASTDQVESLCHRLGVGDYRHQPLHTYSSGMKKKVSLVMALLGEPRWILLDEPLITLDTAAQQELLEIIAERRQEGVSFLLSSHQPWPTDRLPVDGTYTLQNQTLVAT